MSNGNSKQRIIAIAAVAIVLLLGVNAFLLVNKYKQDEVNVNLTSQLDEASQLKVELEKQYYEALSELEEMRSSNESLNAMIEQQKAELSSQKDRIAGLISNGRNLKAAREEMVALTAQVEQYIGEINRLKGENEQLNNVNQRLGQEKMALETDLQGERMVNEELSTAKAALVSEKENLVKEREDLSKKVSIGSVVEVDEVIVTGFKMKNSGKAVKKKYAKNIDHLKLCFNTESNPITEPGTEQFFVRIINPLGETLAIEELGSGVMNSSATGEQIRYTQIKEYDYNRDEQTLCMLWQPNTSFSKGNYEVEIYNKGYIAGKGAFSLK